MNKNKREWFDSDSLWIEMYPYMFPEKRFADAVDQMDKVLKLVNPTGKSVLDLGCGPGRCAIALAQRGFSVTGVDRTEFFLRKARLRTRKMKVRVEWIKKDMRRFLRPEGFDFVLNFFTTFGYFDSKQDDILVLRNILTNLKPGGICLIEMFGKERLAREFQPTMSTYYPDGTLLIQRHEVFDGWTRIRNEWILLRGGRTKTFNFHHTVYSGQEIRDRLEEVGFEQVRLYGGLDGEDYGLNAQRLVAVGRKPLSAGEENHRVTTLRRPPSPRRG